MRDYFILAIILLSVPGALFSPYYGVLVWSWIAYFNPHRYGWGIAHDAPVALMIAIPTLVGTIFAPKNSRVLTRESVLLLMLWMWLALTTYYMWSVPAFAGHEQEATVHLKDISKILLMTMVTILLVNSREKLRVLVLVILGSFGLRALFAAVFFVKTGGQYKVWGPEGSFLEDNNDFALGLNMTLPMFFYMARAESQKWVRVTIRFLMVCVIVSIVGTYSRGGLVGLTVVALAIVAQSRRKILGMLLVGVAVTAIATVTTAQWKDRMDTFAHGNLDSSAESRLAIWKGGWNLVKDYPLTGGGLDVYTDPSAFSQYIPAGAIPETGLHGAHSIYFQMLGEQGFVGLGLFLALLGSSYMTTRKLGKAARRSPQVEWARPYSDMFQVTLLAYMSNGATLGRAYFDFFYQVIACVIILKILVQRDCRSLAAGGDEIVPEGELVAT